MMKISSACANDDFFEALRARNTPIKSSIRSVAGLPNKLKLFRISGSRYWQLRYFHDGHYTQKSLKTADVAEAENRARLFYKQTFPGEGLALDCAPQNESIDPLVADQWHDEIAALLNLEQGKVQRDEMTQGSYLICKTRLEGFVFEYFKAIPFESLNSNALEGFVQFLTARELSALTIQGYLSIVKKLLRFLYKKELIAKIPLLPKVKSNHRPRGAFTITEYQQILRKARQLQKQRFLAWGEGQKIWIREAYHQMPPEMHWLIRFMVHTFTRPGDIRQIQNKHIEIIRQPYRYLRLTLPEIKRHAAPIVSLPAAVQVYEKLLAHQQARGYGRPDDYVFFPEEKNRRYMLDVAGWLFNWILNDLNIKRGPHGVDRSLYSLRHTAITFRLIYGGNIDLLTLARNARTSVEMVEKFYASTLSAEINVAMLHAKRRLS